MIASKLNNLRIASLIALSAIAGCAGGSSGTGTRIVSGRVVDSQGVPLSGVIVAAVENKDGGEVQDSTVTDSTGSFTVELPLGEVITIELQSAEGTGIVAVPLLEDESAGNQLELTISDATSPIEVDNLEVVAKIQGVCDLYFENTRTIRQANRVPRGTVCPLRIWVQRNSIPQDDVESVLEVRGCADQESWRIIAFTSTENGFAEINFEFQDDQEHCVYRVRTPNTGNTPIIHEILTFSAQR